jgi:hypothetical protein
MATKKGKREIAQVRRNMAQSHRLENARQRISRQYLMEEVHAMQRVERAELERQMRRIENWMMESARKNYEARQRAEAAHVLRMTRETSHYKEFMAGRPPRPEVPDLLLD